MNLFSQDNLSEKLEMSMVQVEHYRIACEESQNASRALKRENERFKTQIKDHSQQIQVIVLSSTIPARRLIEHKPVPSEITEISSRDKESNLKTD